MGRSMGQRSMTDEELVHTVRYQVKKLYLMAFRHGFFTCLFGSILFYIFFI